MKILIVEDEKLAFERLKRLIENTDIDVSTITWAKSISESIDIINQNEFDLGFFDIELSDGLSFEIFDKTKVEFPVVFTTAYNQYAVKAFKLNSVDYLLKPIDKSELQNAISKFKDIWQKKAAPQLNDTILQYLKTSVNTTNYKSRFTIKVGEHIKLVETKDIAMFYSLNKGVYVKTIGNKNYVVDYSLDKIIEMIAPKEFFKISRQHIINLAQIKDIIAYSNSRLKILMQNIDDDDIIVSREKVKEFKQWIDS